MNIRQFTAAALLASAGAALLPGCPSDPAPVKLQGQVSLTLLHTSDIHSRLFPYDFQISSIDAALGLGPANTVARVGGAARVSHIVQRERARADRVLHLDGGDCFEGAPVFNFFNGEAELRTLAEMGTDLMIVANHEFDKGALNLSLQLQKWTPFPVLAANYKFDNIAIPGSPQLSKIVLPWTSFNLDGLKVGVIGMGNLSSLGSLFDQPNSSGIAPLNTQWIAQFYVDLIRPLVDVVVMVTHLGLDVDEAMIESTSGIDIVLGGHNHIALQPPKVLQDCQNVDEKGEHYINILSSAAQADTEDPKYDHRRCTPRKVVLAHSGAFAKYVGRLDSVLSNRKEDVGPDYDPVNGFEVIAHEYQLFPVTEATPEDTRIKNLLLPYQQGLDALVDLDLVVGYAPDSIVRAAPAGGDSALGNMVATAMWLRQGVQTDFSLTNTLGIRANIDPGPVTIEQMYNVFPFDNSISKMQLSGVEVQKMFDFSARRSASRGCASQIQIAGARIVMDCNGCDWDTTPRACTSDVDCPGGGVCNAAKKQCALQACVENSDCPNSGRCLKSLHKCEPQACAPSIFIGRSEKHVCSSDADCAPDGKGQVGSCDTFNLDDKGRGHCGIAMDPIASYELATSNYLATGGSGFSVLKANTTQFDTKIQQRDALIDFIRGGKPCGYSDKFDTPEGLKSCTHDADCGDAERSVCACTGGVSPDPNGTCSTKASGCSAGSGRCVLRGCRDDLAAFHRRTCESGSTTASKAACEASLDPCELGGETCKFVACIDSGVGAITDNRQYMVGR